MNTDEALQQLLDRDWTEDDLRLAATLLDALEATPEGRDALRRNDRVRELLRNPEPDAQPAAGWARFERSQPPAASPGPVPVPVPKPWRSAALLRAAVLLIAATGWFLYFLQPIAPAKSPHDGIAGTSPPTNHNRASGARFVTMTTGEVAQQVGLFGNVASVFDERAKWVAVSGSAAEMGLATTPMPANGRLILLRLAVLKGGSLMSRSDLAILPGQDADVSLPLEGGQQVHYRISATATTPTRLSLWAELQRPGVEGQTLAALATELSAKSGDLINAGELHTSSGQYQFELGFFESTPTQTPTETPR